MGRKLLQKIFCDLLKGITRPKDRLALHLENKWRFVARQSHNEI
jgi:hypothetical protein